MFSGESVYLFVCLCSGLLKNFWKDFDDFFLFKDRDNPRSKWLDFDGDRKLSWIMDHFPEFFTVYWHFAVYRTYLFANESITLSATIVY